MRRFMRASLLVVAWAFALMLYTAARVQWEWYKLESAEAAQAERYAPKKRVPTAWESR